MLHKGKDNAMYFYLIYISSATELMDIKSLRHLLHTSRRINRANDITGMLVYVEGYFLANKNGRLKQKLQGRFIQVLEGREIDVRARYRAIEADFRHYNLDILTEGFLKKRNFDHWEMGFRCLGDIESSDPAEFTDLEIKFKVPERDIYSNPLLYLSSFYQMSKSKV
ncbi:Sensors of blue-light using FAD [Pedobacter westerhofensis]|uniref:Sensors of blue-light using FAD n=1 Tax=Pedobacter westerhofensis TaxID=425512 RepID=A0A521F7W0_9SPHI|nr:BLUF domain-containing protein [Pedobacter westerhofensis]SMO92285.1 Sensors of blue-light using FAD [Pedobacter westerhofensis]